MKRTIRRVRREFTAEEQAEWERMVAEVEAEKAEILADARKFFARRRRVLGRLSEVLRLLQAERERQGLSLADIQERTGIDRSTLSKLENADDANPTISTLLRYAEALGKELIIGLVGDDVSVPPVAPGAATGSVNSKTSPPKKNSRPRPI